MLQSASGKAASVLAVVDVDLDDAHDEQEEKAATTPLTGAWDVGRRPRRTYTFGSSPAMSKKRRAICI